MSLFRNKVVDLFFGKSKAVQPEPSKSHRPTNLLGPCLSISLETPPLVAEVLLHKGELTGSVRSYLDGLDVFYDDGEIWLADTGKRAFYTSPTGYYRLKHGETNVQKLEEFPKGKYASPTPLCLDLGRDWLQVPDLAFRAGPTVNGVRPAFPCEPEDSLIIKWRLTVDQMVALVAGSQSITAYLWSLSPPVWGGGPIDVPGNTLLTGQGERVRFAETQDGEIQLDAYKLRTTKGEFLLYPLSGSQLYTLSCSETHSRVSYSGEWKTESTEWSGGIPTLLLPVLPVPLKREAGCLIWRSDESNNYARDTYVSTESNLILRQDSLTGTFEHSHHTDTSA